MAKSKKIKPQQQLSPEAYIRKKARLLPLYECLLNRNWKEEGMAEIVVSRVHTNGNITFGVYMVDLLCVGIKDTFVNFNYPLSDYEEMKEKMCEQLDVDKVDYTLVHNIIFASIEYAEDLGFKPHKDFNSISKYILEEDTEAVELLEIECGKNGKPLFLATNFYTPAQTSGIINQLIKTVGEDNFKVIYENSIIDDEDDEWDEDADDMFDDTDPYLIQEYDGMTPNERRKEYLELYNDGQFDFTVEKMNQLITLSESIYANDIATANEINQYIDQWKDELSIIVSEDEYTAELLGLPSNQALTEDDMDEFDNLDFGLTEEDKEEMTEEEYAELEELQADRFRDLQYKWGDIPYLKYYEIKRLDNETDSFIEKLKAYYAQYPDYPLFKIEMYKFNSIDNAALALPDFKYFFGDRTEITSKEMYEYQSTKTIDLISKLPINYQQLEAQSVLIDELDLSPEHQSVIKRMLLLSKLTLLSKYFEVKEDSI